jgi:hypothetical protein
VQRFRRAAEDGAAFETVEGSKGTPAVPAVVEKPKDMTASRSFNLFPGGFQAQAKVTEVM